MSEARQPYHVCVFLSSPGDVGDERALARHLLKDELPYDPFLRNRFTFDVVSWDDPEAPIPIDAAITPQEAVNRFGAKPSECDVVVVVLWSRMGTHLDLSAFGEKPSGGPYLSGTEWEFEDALNAPQPRRPTIFVYRRTEEFKVGATDPNRAEKFRQFDLVEEFLRRFRNPDGSFRRGFTPYDTPTDFKERLANDLKHFLHERLREHPNTVTSASAAASGWTGSPYPGLRPFTTEEAAIFFGRGREVDALIARLRDPGQRFLAVVGASGSGKSSLVRAGLLPRLRDGAIEGSQHWRVLALTPGAFGDDPFLALASELRGLLPPAEQRPQVEVARMLAKAPQRLAGYADALLAGRPAGAALVLFVDQLEELFTLTAEGHRRGFIELLAQAAADPRLRVLATLRADFLPQCAAEPALAALLQGGTFVLGPPGPVALADMIRRPAERAGLALEEGVVDAILKDAGGDPGEALPLVAFCLEELYRRTAPEHRLTLDAYRAMDGLRGAVGRRAGELLEEIRGVEEGDLDAALPQVFRALVHVDAAGKAARRRAAQDELTAAPPPVPQLVKRLIDPGRLLLADNIGERTTVTLAHEALIQEWPDLREWLEHNRIDMQRVQQLLLLLVTDEANDRQYAAKALGAIGPRAVEAVPAVVPALVTALQDADQYFRRAAAEALGRIGPARSEVIPALVTALQDTAEDVRRTATQALGHIGPAAAEAVPALITTLRDAKPSVRGAAATILGRIGPALAEVVPALAAALQDTSEVVRGNAAEALGQIGAAAAEAVPALVAVLQDANWDVRQAAILALKQIGPASGEVVSALVAALQNSSETIREVAASTLGRNEPAAAAAVPALFATLQDPERSVRRAAVEALGRIGPVTPEVVPALVAALQDAHWSVRGDAAYALLAVGPAAAAAVPALVTALQDADEVVRAAAVKALGQIGPAVPEMVPALMAALRDTDPVVRKEATFVLGEIGPAAAVAVPALVIALDDAQVEVRQAAAKALERIGPAAAEAVPALVAVLCGIEPNARRAAVYALKRIGSAAVPALVTALCDAKAGIHRAAAEASGQIGSTAAEAVPALRAALSDAEADVRQAASDALKRIESASA